jgi:NADH-quinone oxidoreductase subunit M
MANIYNWLNLSTIIWLPICSGVIMLLFNNKYINKIYYIVTTINVIAAVLLYKNFDLSQAGWQFIENHKLLPSQGIYYALGIDGIGLLLILLSGVVNFLIGLLAIIWEKNYRYYASLLIIVGLVNGILSATNALLFYMFFELMLIPLFFVVGVWGREKRIQAAIKFIIYNMIGTLLFLAAIIYLYQLSIDLGVSADELLDLRSFYTLKLPLQQQIYLFFAFFVAFAIKIPIVPLHGWFTNFHVASPIFGSVVLAAVIMNLGVFALIRFLLPITIDACVFLDKTMILLGLASMLYISLAAIIQKNLKILIAYFTIIHMSLILIGIFVTVVLAKQQSLDLATISLLGTILQMFSYGLIAAGLFLLSGILYGRLTSYKLNDYSGLINSMPIFAKFFMGFCLANIAFPGTAGFVGKFFIVLASFKYHQVITGLIIISLIVSVGYTIWAYKNIIFGAKIKGNTIIADLVWQEKITLLGLGLLIVLLGIYPQPIIQLLNNPVEDLIKIIQYK